jgi:hypothetical protein
MMNHSPPDFAMILCGDYSIFARTKDPLTMKNITGFIILTLLSIIVTSFRVELSSDNEIPYPDGYRNWMHIKSGVVGPEHQNVLYRGFNHVYANEKAVKGYQSGFFPHGSVIVFDVVEAVPKENYTAEGKRRHMDVMVRDTTKFVSTGGWGYAQFESDNSPRMLTTEQKTKCYTCHLKQQDHVFTELRK